MYEMYPEWGPARHRTDEHAERGSRPARRRPRYWEKQLVTAGAPGVDEAETQRPDDN